MRSDIPWLMTSATVVLIAGITLIKPTPRLVWNASASAPIGLYWIVPAEAPRRGDLLAIRSRSGLVSYLRTCPGGEFERNP